MRKLRNDPMLEHHLLTCIRKYTENSRQVVPDSSLGLVREAHIDQTRLGWSNFVKGLWSDRWEKIQHKYYSSLPDKEAHLNIDVWSKKMVQTMFNFFRRIWKERCEINQAQKAGTMDSRIRAKTYAYCKQLQCEIW